MAGLHAVFGAFLFGACLPRDDRLLRCLVERLEYIAIVLLMPIFFALAGLNTTPDAFVGTGLGALLLVLVAACSARWPAARRCARGGLWLAREFRDRCADERARPDGTDRDEGRAWMQA
jgi:hypothetical protein